MNRFLCWMALAAIWLPAGCSKDDLNKAFDKVKQTASDTVDKAKEQVSQANTQAQQQLNLKGNCELNLGAPVVTKACYVTFIPSTGGRSAVLQIKSYAKPEEETSPSMFLQAPVTAAALSELAGQTLKSQLWVQVDANGTIWAPKDAPIELKIVSLDDKQLQAELVGGTMRNVAVGTEVPASGKLTAVISPFGR